ncbi:MAG: heavy metal-associated domain-containing protein [Syntrophaceae bacterium]|nr:heavy metal-associated domain-containing protein [Syntrophaceae bacterium]
MSLEGTDGVEKAEVDIQYATVWYDPAKISADQLVSIVTRAGKDCFPV